MAQKPRRANPDPIRPLIRWAGSKKQLLPILTKTIPADCNRYVEPFAGSACLFFALRPQRAILGDINGELIRMYREVKYRSNALASILQNMHRSKTEFLRLRRVDPVELRRTARAAHFLYLNRFCFNGLYRTNAAGRFNVPYGKRCGSLPTADSLKKCSSALRRTRLV